MNKCYTLVTPTSGLNATVARARFSLSLTRYPRQIPRAFQPAETESVPASFWLATRARAPVIFTLSLVSTGPVFSPL